MCNVGVAVYLVNLVESRVALSYLAEMVVLEPVTLVVEYVP